MCGILAIFHRSQDESITYESENKLKEILERRGPDAHGEIDVEMSKGWRAKFCGYTLWLQGIRPSKQPIVDDDGNILLWNGDIFYFNPENSCDESDTVFLLEKLKKAENEQDISAIMNSIQGPWSFIYYKKNLNSVFTGRDPFGRHSLLWNCNQSTTTGQLLICSAAENSDLIEVPANCLHRIDFSNCEQLAISSFSTRWSYSINNQLPELSDLIEWNADNKEELFQLAQKVWENELNELERVLHQSINERVKCQPGVCKKCVDLKLSGESQCTHSKLAILFSGGLDSAVIAAIANLVWPTDESIDLLNVAFPSKCQNSTGESFLVPDRLTGLQALEELKSANPRRKWNFVQIDVPLEELVNLRQQRIASLIYPSSTVLDDSIGCAQWFAARGKGYLVDSKGEQQPYDCPARVVLMGAGADEQLAGYARHRQRFSYGGWSALISELEMEMKRIPERNLGRDNRIIADHGRAPRLPYLDEKVVAFLASLPIWIKADLRLAVGVGDKLILRVLAYRLGLVRTALEPKRAIQFGSRIAKAESRKEKGSHQCHRLKK